MLGDRPIGERRESTTAINMVFSSVKRCEKKQLSREDFEGYTRFELDSGKFHLDGEIW